MFLLTSIAVYKDFNNFEQVERNIIGVYDDLKKVKEHVEKSLESFDTEWKIDYGIETLFDKGSPVYEVTQVDFNNFS